MKIASLLTGYVGEMEVSPQHAAGSITSRERKSISDPTLLPLFQLERDVKLS